MRKALLMVTGIVAGFAAGRLDAQALAARTVSPPFLAPGQKVRVWTIELSPFRRMPLFAGTLQLRYRGARVVGVLSAYQPPDSLSLERSAVLVAPWTGRRYSTRWDNVRRIDVPNGREGPWWGVGAGVGAAVAVGFTVIFMERLVSWDSQHLPRGHNIPTYSARAAIVTIPVGVIVGLLATKWRQVY